MSNSESMQFAPMRVVVRARSPAAASYVRSAGINPEAAVPQEAAIFGAAPSTADDLIFHGGKTIQDLKFTNFYVAGDTAWDATDIQNIDQALSAAMSDVNLNNVMLQYYNGPITSQFLGSHTLPGVARRRLAGRCRTTGRNALPARRVRWHGPCLHRGQSHASFGDNSHHR